MQDDSDDDSFLNQSPRDATVKATELIVKCLENEGVEYIFGVPGEENMALLDALLGSSIRFVMTRHEQGAAFMADVYGRLTGKAGVCLSTLGPGATNLITGVADANMDRAPLVALTAQAGHDRMHKESHQHLDIVTLFRPVTKWNTSLPIPDIIPEAFRKAFKLAQSEKPGATHIEIPEDVARHGNRRPAAARPMASSRRSRAGTNREGRAALFQKPRARSCWRATASFADTLPKRWCGSPKN